MQKLIQFLQFHFFNLQFALFKTLVAGVDSLSTKEFDKSLVENEFLNSPLYKNALVSADFKTTALILHLKDDKKYFEFIEKRENLLKKQDVQALTKEEVER